jgi:hypothetical protein
LLYVFTWCIENSQGHVSEVATRRATEWGQQPVSIEIIALLAMSISEKENFDKNVAGLTLLEYIVHILRIRMINGMAI